MDPLIPDKLYFKIGEVAEIVGVRPHVLRYWESEFSRFRPAKSSKNQRLYRRQDIELVLRVKDLLYNQGFTIAGAKRKLREENGAKERQDPDGNPSGHDRELLLEVRNDLLKLRTFLQKGKSSPRTGG
ncbi:MAG: MerR family transcriptional regulator [Deltaproteobacteria bacterium]|nr:MerR family transcriptional regulator [Deltaproteobacteria bacterium]